jgi:biotin operon repressor
MLSRWRFILSALRSGQMITCRSLARKWEVSYKTVHRDIECLRNLGLEIETITGRGFLLRNGCCPFCDSKLQKTSKADQMDQSGLGVPRGTCEHPLACWVTD